MDGNHPRFYGAQTRGRPQVLHRFDSRGVGTRGEGDVDAHGAHFGPQRVVGEAAGEHVPGVGGGDAAGGEDAGHFGDAFGGVGDEEDDEGHDGGVEGVGRERKCHCIAEVKLCERRWASRGGVGELGLRGVDAVDGGGGAGLNEQFGECAVAAADVEPAEGGFGGEPVEEGLGDELAPDAHVAFVGGGVVEADLTGGHDCKIAGWGFWGRRLASCRTDGKQHWLVGASALSDQRAEESWRRYLAAAIKGMRMKKDAALVGSGTEDAAAKSRVYVLSALGSRPIRDCMRVME